MSTVVNSELSEKKTVKPWDHQKVVLKDLKNAVRVNETKLMVYMASALGKTFLICFFLKWLLGKKGNLRRRNSRILILCHQNDILEQFIEPLQLLFDAIKFPIGFCFSGFKDTKQQIILASFQTIGGILGEFNSSDFDVVVVDECHHSAADTYKYVIDYFISKYRIGLTATPFRSDGRSLEEIFPYQIARYPLHEALEKDLLAQIEYSLMSDADPQKIAEVLEESQRGELYTVKELNRLFFIQQRDEEIVRQINRFVIEKSISNPKVMIFASTIAHANHFASLMPGALVTHSDLSSKIQKERLAVFKNCTTGVMVCVNKLNEGFDVPEVNMVVFLRTTNSIVKFLQQLGRGLRKKIDGNIVWILDFVANCKRLGLMYQLVGSGSDNEAGNTRKSRPSPELLSLKHVNFNFAPQLLSVLELLKRAAPSYSKEDIIKCLQNLASSLGRTPSIRDVDRVSKRGEFPCAATIINTFNSYNNAISAAGFSPNHIWVNHDLEEVICQVKRLAERLGRTPTGDEIDEAAKRGECPREKVIVRLFNGSLNNLFLAAGLNPNLVPADKEVILKQLKELANELGRTPTTADLRVYSKLGKIACTGTIIKAFDGSMNNAFEAAGLVVNVKKITKEIIIQQLKTLAQELGRTPTVSDIELACKQGKCTSYPAILDRFDHRLNLALEAAGLQVNDNYERPKIFAQKNSKEKVILQLQALAEELGKTPSYAELVIAAKEGKIPGVKRLCKLFSGTPNDALIAAGLKPNKRGYTKAQVFDQLHSLFLQLQRLPRWTDIESAGKKGVCANPSTMVRLFNNSFEDMIESFKDKFKLINISPKDLKRQEIIQQLKDLGRKLGRMPMTRDIRVAAKNGECCALSTISNYFDKSITNALIAAGYRLEDRTFLSQPKYSDEYLIRQYIELSRRLGKEPSYGDIDRARKEGLCVGSSTFIFRFSSIDKLRKAAAIFIQSKNE